MDAKEFRIGNYVYEKYWNSSTSKFENSLIEICAIHKTHIRCQDDCAYNFEDIEPIPLTEEILINCGFKNFNFTDKEKGFIIEHKEPSKSVYIRTFAEPNIKGFFNVFNRCECNRKEIQYIKKIEFLHELQNIYFALTNKELTVKL